MAFQNVSSKLKREVDLFMSGYLIPNLQPIEGHDAEKKPWGTMGSRVRGICYTYNSQKNFGFIRFLKDIGPGLWITDTRRDDSPYGTAFAHESSFEPGTDFFHLPSRDHIFEFDLTKGDKGLQASNITSVYPPHKSPSSKLHYSASNGQPQTPFKPINALPYRVKPSLSPLLLFSYRRGALPLLKSNRGS